jgi:ABC-type multidrug transport system ATPase subunit
MVSGRHARLEWSGNACLLTPLSQSNKTLLNDRPIETPVPVKAGDRIRLGFTGPAVEILSLAPVRPSATPAPARPHTTPTPQVGPPPSSGATVLAEAKHFALLRGSRAAERMVIGRGGIIGRGPQVEFVLDHPHISRQHARVSVDGQQVRLRDLGSANGTFVNGRCLNRPALLKRGDRIDIGPFSLTFDGDALVSRSRANNIELAARRLNRVVKDRATGNPLSLLDDINLVIHPREFVCLLGPSGSGKSTLLAILSGRNPPDGGAVTVNGESLHDNFAALRQDIAVVPQKDVLHDSLAVGTALRYTAELRLPSDTSRAEVESSVSDILDVVGLSKRRHTLIRHLSGGQVKRASLANELMARPTLLFVDEATSGLDEQTDRDMMELFRQVADSGKTVVCITHNLANVEATCHLVVILTEGGRLAFVGTPDEAKGYFGVVRLGDVYRKLGERKPEEWQTAFRSSPFYSLYVRDRMAGGSALQQEEGAAPRPQERAGVNPFRQAWILTRRYVSIWRGDLQALLAMLGQSLLVAVLLGIVFGRLDSIENPVERAPRTVNLLFLLNVSCFWLGCNNAAKELVKERIIYTRERDFNLRIDSYFVSKLIVLVLIGLVQVSLLFGIVRAWCDPPGDMVKQAAVLAGLVTAGAGLGLLISAFAHSEEVAAALVPIAIIPQIILAGVIAPLRGLGKWMAEGAITVRWGEQALEALLPDKDLALLGMERASYGWRLAVVAVHVVVFTGTTLLVLWRQSRAK